MRDHRRLPHGRSRQRCRRRDGVDHQRFERALAELAEQEPHEEIAFCSVARANNSPRTRVRSPLEPAPAIEAMRASAASTSQIVSEGSRRQRRAAHRAPVRSRCRFVPGASRRTDTQLPARFPRVRAWRQAASSAVLALRLPVSATRRDVSASSASSVIRRSYGRLARMRSPARSAKRVRRAMPARRRLDRRFDARAPARNTCAADCGRQGRRPGSSS